MAFNNFNHKRRPDAEQKTSPSLADTSIPADWGAPPVGVEPVSSGNDGLYGEPSPYVPAAADPLSSESTVVAARNVLNADVSVVGKLRFTDDLLVDGTVEGEISSDGILTVGKNATIQAGADNKVAIHTQSAIIHGRVTGDIVVTDRIELSSTAELVGDVSAARISIQEGAVFIGNCHVGSASVAATTPKKSSKTSALKEEQANLLS
ncbi:MAG TPA: polymer-forming cytoskeletal protein [Candidatus Akkermansia intestinigallinarum]|uniref:Polymer-forming cytoskeletal protein n=1 Tax=Candidatus Akkermansia intestinigallinarum TaxID=2838431 RepID=A0A9D1VB20_9BACT|nr:polymer-forming cytoskeletal protein [Candidatus Akkermansia intestinigallinarum]